MVENSEARPRLTFNMFGWRILSLFSKIPIAYAYIRVAVDLIFPNVLDCTKTVIEAKVTFAFHAVWIYFHVFLLITQPVCLYKLMGAYIPPSLGRGVYIVYIGVASAG